MGTINRSHLINPNEAPLPEEPIFHEAIQTPRLDPQRWAALVPNRAPAGRELFPQIRAPFTHLKRLAEDAPRAAREVAQLGENIGNSVVQGATNVAEGVAKVGRGAVKVAKGVASVAKTTGEVVVTVGKGAVKATKGIASVAKKTSQIAVAVATGAIQVAKNVPAVVQDGKNGLKDGLGWLVQGLQNPHNRRSMGNAVGQVAYGGAAILGTAGGISMIVATKGMNEESFSLTTKFVVGVSYSLFGSVLLAGAWGCKKLGDVLIKPHPSVGEIIAQVEAKYPDKPTTPSGMPHDWLDYRKR